MSQSFRGGSVGRLGEVFESLADMSTKYGLKGEWVVEEGAVLENVFAKFMSPRLPHYRGGSPIPFQSGQLSRTPGL